MTVDYFSAKAIQLLFPQGVSIRNDRKLCSKQHFLLQRHDRERNYLSVSWNICKQVFNMYLMSSVQRKRKTRVRERVKRSSADIRREYIDRRNVFRGCSESLMISVAIKSTSREVIHQNQNWHCWVLPKGKIWKLCVPHNLMLPSTVLAKNPNVLQYTEVANCKSFHIPQCLLHVSPSFENNQTALRYYIKST